MSFFLILSISLSLIFNFTTGSMKFGSEFSENILFESPQGIADIYDSTMKKNQNVTFSNEYFGRSEEELWSSSSDEESSGADSELDFYLESRKKIDIYDALYDKLSLPLTSNHYLPAYEAALKGDLEKLKLISKMNISLDNHDLKTGETPLHAACRRGNLVVLEFLCTRVKNLVPQSRSGRTPFAISVIKGDKKVVFLLLRFAKRFGADIPDHNGVTPIMHAALNGHLDIFKILKFFRFDYLRKDKSGRGLLSILTPASPCYAYLLSCIKKQLNEDRLNTIISISSDLSYLYRNGFQKNVHDIIKTLDLSMQELISSPQPHSSNILMAIFDTKDYGVYRHYRYDPVNGFDINAINEFDDQTFFNRCLEFASKETVEYLITNEILIVNFDSYTIIMEKDDLELLQLIEQKFGLTLEFEDVNLVALAGIHSANRCFKYLLKHFSSSFSYDCSSLFCDSAIKISESKNKSAIMNLFDRFSRGLATCTSYELKIMRLNLFDQSKSYRRQIGVLNKIIELKNE